MSDPADRRRVDPAGTGLLLVTLAVAGLFESSGPIVGVAIAVAGVTASVLLRAAGPGVPGAIPPVPALLALAVLAVQVPAAALTELLVASAALALLYWNGADGATAAVGRDRARALGLPGLATVVAVLVPLVVPTISASVGVGLAAILLVLVLVAAAAYLAPPGALRTAAPAS